jgi:surface protein
MCYSPRTSPNIPHFRIRTKPNVTIADLSLFLNCCTHSFTLSEATVALTNHNLRGAVDLWVSNQFEATATYGDISSWDVSAVTNMEYMFYQAKSFNSNISAWNVSSVTSMYAMFADAHAFNQDISGWDVSRVTSMGSMFYFASVFNQNISEWDVSSVTSMDYMFAYASAFEQFLCAWGCKLPAGVVTGEMFSGKNGCPVQDNPSFDITPPGPFCYACDSTCPKSAATSGP